MTRHRHTVQQRAPYACNSTYVLRNYIRTRTIPTAINDVPYRARCLRVFITNASHPERVVEPHNNIISLCSPSAPAQVMTTRRATRVRSYGSPRGFRESSGVHTRRRADVPAVIDAPDTSHDSYTCVYTRARERTRKSHDVTVKAIRTRARVEPFRFLNRPRRSSAFIRTNFNDFGVEIFVKKKNRKTRIFHSRKSFLFRYCCTHSSAYKTNITRSQTLYYMHVLGMDGVSETRFPAPRLLNT